MTARGGAAPDDLGVGSPMPPGLEPAPGLTDAQRADLVTDNWPAIEKVVDRMLFGCAPWADIDDMHGAASIALVLAADSFDPDRGIPFLKHATYRVRFALKDNWRHHEWLTKYGRQRGRTAPVLVYSDASDALAYRVSVVSAVTFEDQLIRVIDGNEAITAGFAALSPKGRLVILALFRDDRTLRSVAAELGVSESRVSQLKTAALKVMRSAAA